MKALLLSLTFAALAATAPAQVFGPTTAGNVLLGGIAGAVIGDHNHHQALAGAAIGATAGYVWSLATTPHRAYYSQPGVPVYYAQNDGYGYTPRATVMVGVGGPAYCAPSAVYYSRPAYYARPGYYAPRVWGPGYGRVVYGRPAFRGRAVGYRVYGRGYWR